MNEPNMKGLTLTDEQQQVLNSLLANERRSAESRAYAKARDEASAELALASEGQKLLEEAKKQNDDLLQQKSSLAQLVNDLQTKSAVLEKDFSEHKEQSRKKQHALQEFLDKTRINNAVKDSANWAGDVGPTWLAQHCQLDGENVVVKLPGSENSVSLSDAVKTLQSDIPKYGNLFRANVNGGAGTSNGRFDGGPPRAMNVRSMTSSEYMAIRARAKQGDAQSQAMIGLDPSRY